MKLKNLSYTIALAAVGLSFSACEDFLDRPAEDTYNTDNFYQNDEQLYQSVNSLYNSPWYDFQRGFFKVGEVMSGNYYWGSSPYLTFTVNSSDEDLVNMSASLWSVNAYCNTAIKNINEKAGADCTQEAINATKGEALTWKAMAYFYLVRSFGGVPIIHDNTAMINEGTYNDVYRATPENVYDYIIMTLEQALEWVPTTAESGRIDKYCVKALLAKVYLTKAGLSGTLNNDDLQKAVDYAKDVKDNSGRALLENYSDVFRLANNRSEESLIAWRWTAESNIWTCQNTLQSDLGLTGFSEYGDCWGDWGGPSLDLLAAFGEDPTKATRVNTDTRRKATCMMADDAYEYFWTDRSSTFTRGGFEVLDFYFENNASVLAARGNLGGGGTYNSPTGANSVKHLVGDDADHVAGIGYSMQRMATSLATHLLRLSDVYLILAEAQCLLDGKTTSNADALDAFYQVRHRAVSSYQMPTSITFDDIWKERRLELACEGDRYYDYVRRAYYDYDAVVAELKAQDRGTYSGLSDLYKSFYSDGQYNADVFNDPSINKATHQDGTTFEITSLTLPFPDTDLAMNPHLSEEPVEVDITQYTY